MAKKKQATEKAMYTVRSAESKHAGANVRGAVSEGTRLAVEARRRAQESQAPA